jgi:hypothetical protein
MNTFVVIAPQNLSGRTVYANTIIRTETDKATSDGTGAGRP